MAVQATAAAVQNIRCLRRPAASGACWMCAPLFAAAVRAALGLPEDWEPPALVTLGFPTCRARAPASDRRDIDLARGRQRACARCATRDQRIIRGFKRHVQAGAGVRSQPGPFVPPGCLSDAPEDRSRSLGPGQKISTLEGLEREFEVARVTVRQAIELLAEEGLLYCQQGRGTFVADEPPKRRWLNLATDWTSLIEPIKDHVPKMLKVQNQAAAPVCGREKEGRSQLRLSTQRPVSRCRALLACQPASRS